MNIGMKGLMENLERKEFHHNIDLVLEGGCINGAYEIGGLLLLKELEKKKKITVHRLSGTSIGAFISLLYSANKLDCFVDSYKEWRQSFNDTIKIQAFEETVKKICSEISDDTFKSLQKNKIFITYFDVKLKKCILKKEYSTRRELWESVLKSCHIPYLVNGNAFYKTSDGEYLDGGLPYIFKLRTNDDRKILYMKIIQSSKLVGIFCSRGEESIDGRVLEGLLDTYNFFMQDQNTSMCSFVNNWGYINLIRYNSINFVYLIGIYMFILLQRTGEYISPSLEKMKIYQKMKPACKKLYEDILRYIAFK